MLGNVNIGMKRRILSLGHIIWMMRRTASKTICLLRWQNCGQIIAVKSVAYISMAYCAKNEWNWSLAIDHNHKRNFENNISLEQLITTLPHQRVVWQLWPTAPLPNIGLLKKVNKVEPKSCRLRRRGKEFVWQIHMSHSASDKSNQSRLYLKVQTFEVSRKRKKNRWWIFSIQRKSRSDLWKSRKMDGTRWQKYKQELVGKMSRLSQKCWLAGKSINAYVTACYRKRLSEIIVPPICYKCCLYCPLSSRGRAQSTELFQCQGRYLWCGNII